MKLKIGLYTAYSIMSAGVFTYTNGIIQLLLQSEEVEVIKLIISRDQFQYFYDKGLLNNSKIEFVFIDFRSNYFYNLLFRFYKLILYIFVISEVKKDFYLKILPYLNPLKYIFEKIKVDLIHVPFPISLSYFIKTPIIVTMHDVQDLRFPEYFTSYERVRRAIDYKIICEFADHIIVSFDHVKADLIRYFSTNDSQVSVASISFSSDWFCKSKESDVVFVRNKYLLDEQYVFYPAATWQHKNHINLLNALIVLSNNGINVKLVCSGVKTHYYQNIENMYKNEPIWLNVKFLGSVSEAELITLFKASSLVVIPTKYEAGSAPLFEAMRYNIPVICSNVTSLPESIGDKEFVFDPENVTQIAELIKKGLYDEKYRERSIENSNKRMGYYSAKNYVDPLINAYKRSIISKKDWSAYR